MGDLKKYLLLFLFAMFIQFFAVPETTFAQTDTEFWFVAPSLTKNHGWENHRFFMRFASMNIPARVTVSMPANPQFEPVIFELPPNSAHTIDLTTEIESIWNFPPAQVNNRGIHVEASSLITAYFEVGTINNPDIYSLKGSNALGEDFFVPFQNYFRNGNYSPDQPFSKIDVVATQDNTTVTFLPSRAAFPGQAAGVPLTVTLNKGETYCLAPDQILLGGYPREGQLPENRLAGTRVTSDKPVAVTTSDDSVWASPHGGCKDLIGDQLIPVSIIGTEYIAMRGRLSIPEFFYVLGTQNDTKVYVDGLFYDNINEGEIIRYEISDQTHHILTTNPSYVYHVGGFGCEMGGAILPPVNVCTGSTQVSFTRSKGESFFLNILVRAGAEDGFIFNGDGPNTVIPAAEFKPVEGTSQWLAAEFEFNQTQVPIAQARLIKNVKDVFHLGIINGGTNSGTMYGYFSNFNQMNASSMIIEAGTDFEAFCYGQPVQLIATGGTEYSWSPPDFLNDPFSDSPVATPDQSMQYVVTVSGACDMVDSASVTIQVADPLHAIFTTDVNKGCSPLDIIVSNQSIGVEYYTWTFGDGEQVNGQFDQYQHTYVNNTDSVQRHNIRLIGKNDLFCTDEMSAEVLVYPEVKALAAADVISGCAPLTVNFSNNSTGAEQYLWKFGDGERSGLAEPTHTFENFTDNEIDYTVILESVNKYGCLDFDTVIVNVKPYIKAGFEFDPSVHCSPVDLSISNSASGAEFYSWNFDDGQLEQDYDSDVVNYYFENHSQVPDTFNIQQLVYNRFGCADTLMRPLVVLPSVVSEFEPSLTQGCSPLAVDFENLSSGAVSYSWVFGQNHGNSSENSPTVEFVNNDSQTAVVNRVNLEVVSEYGCRDSSFVEIEVFPSPKASFAFNDDEVCAPARVVFNNLSAGGSNHLWDFGDGSRPVSSNVPELIHVFDAAENTMVYQILLQVKNDFGCQDEQGRQITVFPEVKAEFSVPVSGCHPLDVQFENTSAGAENYYWNFGDGGSSSLNDPQRAFLNYSHFQPDTFRVQLIAESDFLCRDTMEVPLVVFPKPEAVFNVTTDKGCAPLEVGFSENAIGSTSYSWSFGDGTIQYTIGGDEQYVYYNEENNPLNFETVLEVINEYGCVDTASRNILVYPEVKARMDLEEPAGCHPFEPLIINNSTGADASTPYFWFYGDGSSSTHQGQTHKHVFENFSHHEVASYNIKLIAKSQYGCIDSLFHALEVFPVPEALFSAPDEPSCSPFEVEFTDLSAVGINAAYQWDFGDGNQSQHQGSTLHIFEQAPGDETAWFNVSLQISNEFGCLDTFESSVGVYPAVIAEFRIPEEGCHPLEAEFENFSQGATNYQWQLPQESSSSLSEPTFLFTNYGNLNPKTYQVSLMANNSFGCKSVTSKAVTVFPLPLADFSINPAHGCAPLQAEISNTTIGANTYLWHLEQDTVLNSDDQFSWLFTNNSDQPENSTLKIEAANQWGCKKSFSQQVVVYPEVKAAFTSLEGTFEGCTPLRMPFVNQSQRADDFIWLLGDGTQSTGVNPEHWYFAHQDTLADYQVTLAASSSFGCSDTISKLVRVHPRPVADFSVTPHDQVYPSSTVNVSNLSVPGDWLYTWSMGDGKVFSENVDTTRFSYTYIWDPEDLSTKHYNINLKVENNWCSDEIQKQIIIRAPDPVVNFSPQTQGCPPFEVQFTSYSQYGSAFLWDFDDGNYSTEENPRHTFVDPGVYEVKLLVSGAGGLDSAYKYITVHQPPMADFKVIPAEVVLPDEPVQMVNLSSLGSTYYWDFGDGNHSYEFAPSHYYQNAGVYDISLIVGSATEPACYDTLIVKSAATAQDVCVLHFPNAFSPSTDGPVGGYYTPGDPLNHVFYPVYQGIEDYSLEIFNRWGELIFRSEDPLIGWDGYHRDELSKMDVYVWKVKAKCRNGEEINKAGDVTLYR